MKCEISACWCIYTVSRIWPCVLKSLQQSMCAFVKHILNIKMELNVKKKQQIIAWVIKWEGWIYSFQWLLHRTPLFTFENPLERTEYNSSAESSCFICTVLMQTALRVKHVQADLLSLLHSLHTIVLWGNKEQKSCWLALESFHYEVIYM